MYTTYTYDLSKDTGMNMNLNLKDCFEETDVSSVDINKILNDINFNFIKNQEEKVEEAPSIHFTKSSTKSSTKSFTTSFKPTRFTTSFKKYKL